MAGETNDPAPGLAGRVEPLRRSPLGSACDMRDEAAGENDLQCGLAVVPGGGAQVLAAGRPRCGPLDDTCLQVGFKATYAIDVRPGRDERPRPSPSKSRPSFISTSPGRTR